MSDLLSIASSSSRGSYGSWPKNANTKPLHLYNRISISPVLASREYITLQNMACSKLSLNLLQNKNECTIIESNVLYISSNKVLYLHRGWLDGCYIRNLVNIRSFFFSKFSKGGHIIVKVLSLFNVDGINPHKTKMKGQKTKGQRKWRGMKPN